MSELKLEDLPKLVSELNNKIDRLEMLLQNQTKKKEEDKILSVNDAAKKLNLRPPTIYGLVSRNKIPYHKPKGRKRLYFSKKELEAWMLDNSK